MPRLNTGSALERSFFDAIEHYYEDRLEAGQEHAEAIEARIQQFKTDGYMVRADGTVVDWRNIDEYVWNDAGMDGGYEPELDQNAAIECAKTVAIKRAALIEEAIQHFAEDQE